MKRIDQNTESDQEVKKIVSCLLDTNSFSIETNSYNFIKYTILKLNSANKLFIVGDIAYSLSKDVSILTNKECRYIEGTNKYIYPNILNPSMIKEKIKTEQSIVSNEVGMCYCDAVPQKMDIHVENREPDKINIQKSQSADMMSLIKSAIRMGYEKVDTTKHAGEISVRGGIVDVFSPREHHPFRIEFNDNTIETIRYYNPMSQITIMEVESIAIGNIVTNVNSVETITYKDFLKRFNYKVIYIRSLGSGYNISNKANCKSIKSQKINILKSGQINDKKTKKINKNKSIRQSNELRNKKSIQDSENKIMYEKLDRGITIIFNEYRLISKKDLKERSVQENTYKYNWGDLITHEDFGVGIYRGIVSKNKCDYINIEYDGGSKVQVSAHKMSLISPYVGKPRRSLSKINTKNWKRDIDYTKNKIADIINEMVEVNDARAGGRKNKNLGDEYIENKLIETFPYLETDDQKKAIKDVFTDMTTPGLMDRLIIGDVGFGKTEVALRAAVKCVCSGGFVIVVVPTTVLADQHYVSFKNRLENIGFNIQMISRFVTQKKKTEICKSIEGNHVDILIGTHAILNDNIPKNRLSLIIVDEEHRFGVIHKNKLLKMRGSIDVLTLSATPIPRTLQQSLLGMKSVSLVQTPPVNRLPIKTKSIYKNWDHIEQLISIEINRGGQVYFLHNKIESLPVVYNRLKNLFPNNTVSMAHGQMPTKDLEKAILSFFDGAVNILVCTSIIESGLDISNANTVFINNAHFFGLSQLYQIRGRVGRSNRQAYCYLIVPPVETLSLDAIQRLRALESNTDLGSGYGIALQDLQIRGAGNLFGYEQSGSVDKVGYNLYCKMFEQAVRSKNNQINAIDGLLVNAYFNCSFDDVFMPLSEDRIYYYQRLSSVTNLQALYDIKNQIVDRFGNPSKQAHNMFSVVEIRLLYKQSVVSKIDIKQKEVIYTLKNREYEDFEQSLQFIIKSLNVVGLNHRFKQAGSDLFLICVLVSKNRTALDIVYDCIDCFKINKKNT